MKKLILIAGLFLLGFGSLVHADTASNKNSFYYIFHLYYDSGKLSADRDFKFNYDIIPGDYVADAVTTQFPYRGEVVNMTSEVAGHFVFDPKQGDTKFTKGKVSVKAPYVADAQKVIFYDNQNQPVLTISVSASSFCNDDGICNADRGEDSLSCPKDCKQALPAPPVASTTPAPSSGSSGTILASILYLVGGLILAGLGWWFFKRTHHGPTLPPSQSPPIPPLPTPTVPVSPNNPV